LGSEACGRPSGSAAGCHDDGASAITESERIPPAPRRESLRAGGPHIAAYRLTGDIRLIVSRRRGPGRDGSEPGRSVERPPWTGSLTACRPCRVWLSNDVPACQGFAVAGSKEVRAPDSPPNTPDCTRGIDHALRRSGRSAILRCVTSAQDEFRGFLRDVVSPAMRSAGLKGSAGHYQLPSQACYALVGFQRSASSTASAVKFTMNLKAVSREAWELARADMPSRRAMTRAIARLASGPAAITTIGAITEQACTGPPSATTSSRPERRRTRSPSGSKSSSCSTTATAISEPIPPSSRDPGLPHRTSGSVTRPGR
jgi:hypothetical protein